ncbi:MAG: tetratricopeptide repeat protein [Bacteroides sp.]|jgi:serine phosphatase RsbU (regulator of sigma subunit)/Tfp pilus assembly protein PilF|nr:tetratricopeptide repeat protein [Bacteroides sp.]
MQRLLFFFIFPVLFFSVPCHAQLDIDSLRAEFRKATDPKDKILLQIFIGAQFETKNYDTAFYYLNIALDQAEKLGIASTDPEDQRIYLRLKGSALQGLSALHNRFNDAEGVRKYAGQIIAMGPGKADSLALIVAWLSLGNISQMEGNFPEATEQYRRALELSTGRKDTLNIAKSAHNLGVTYFYMGNLDEAASYTNQALECYSQKNDRLGKSSCLLMLGNLMYDLEDYQKALNYYNESYLGFEELNHTVGKYNAILNIGTILIEEERYPEAIERFENALAMAREINDHQGVVRCLHNMGMSYSQMGDPRKALQHYQEALVIARAHQFKHIEANTLSNMAAVNNDLRQYNEALNLATRSLELSSEIQSLDDQIYAYKNLSIAQEGLGNIRQALEYHKLFKLFNDSLTRIENRREISEVEAQYQTEQIKQEMELKNALLEKQDLELVQQSVSLSRQKIIRNFMIAGLLALFLILLQIYSSSRRRKLANELIMKQNEEIGEQHEKITQQKNIIEEKNLALVSSIRYAQNIQNALLPDETNLQEAFEEYFIIYEPKEIVSGDFYWISRQNGVTLLALADSTGHGVPGAFLSVLGLSFLNEFVARRKYHSPAQLLDEMRLYIISSLHQEETQKTSQEGIEMALLAIDHQNHSVTFSSARTPIYVATKGEIKLDGEPITMPHSPLVKFKGDPMPLSFHRKMKAFSNQTLSLNPGDKVYILTDGFGDQFGSDKRERFTNQRAMKLLEQIFDQPMAEQKETLIKTLYNWKQDCEQIDDIAVIGFRI